MNKSRKMSVLIIVAAVLLLGVILVWKFSSQHGEQPSQALEIYYFYDNPCLSCDDEAVFTQFFNEQTENIRGYCPYTLHVINTFSSTGGELEGHLERLGLSLSDYSDYLLVMNESFLSGADILEDGKLRQMFWRESGLGGTPEVFEYYYRDNCKDCQNISQTMDAFFASHPEIPAVCLDTNDPETKEGFKSLLAGENVPSERVQIPYVIYQGRHYSGNAEIEAALETF